MTDVSNKMLARKAGAIGWMIFNSPERRNAVSKAMRHSMCEIVADFASDRNIRVIIVRGTGDQAFSAGADISEFEKVRATPDDIAEYEALSDRACKALEEVGKPTIAMINGFAMGGGFDIALRCDLRFAVEGARFGIPAARLGLGYPFMDIKRLVDHVGPMKAKEIFFTGRQFTAAEALAMGFVGAVLPSLADLEAHVLTVAGAIAANAPLTIASVKKCVLESVKGPGLWDAHTCEAMVEACFSSQDYIEGRRAFLEKRPPSFQGT
jgi:enoyl-CoA hydratase/carnithine racemase